MKCDDNFRISGVISNILIRKRYDERNLPCYDIVTTLEQLDDANRIKLVNVKFYNARQLELELPLCFSSECLIIESIRDMQWEKCNYHVFEDVARLFAFYCESYKIYTHNKIE